MDATVLGVLLVLATNSLATKFDFSSVTQPDTLLYECGDRHGLWTLEDITMYPGGPISGGVLTSSLEPCCLKLRNFTRIDARSRFHIQFRASFLRVPQDVLLVKLREAETSVQVTWFTFTTVPHSDWVELDETFAATPGQYQIEIWTSAREKISIRYFEIIGSNEDVINYSQKNPRMPKFVTDNVTNIPHEQTVSSWLTTAPLAPDDIDYMLEICSCSLNSSVTSEYLNFSTDSTSESTTTFEIITTTTDITFETKLTTLTLFETLSTTTEILILQYTTDSEIGSTSIHETTTVTKLSSEFQDNITGQSSKISTLSDQVFISESTKSLSTTESATISTETLSSTTFSIQSTSSETINSNENLTLSPTTEPMTIFTVSSETTTSSNEFSTLFSTQPTEESKSYTVSTSTELFIFQANSESDFKEVGITVAMVVLGLVCLLGSVVYCIVRKLNTSATASLKMINIRQYGTNKIKHKQNLII